MDTELFIVVAVVGFFFLAGLIVFGLFVRVMYRERHAEKHVVNKRESEPQDERRD